MTSPMPTPGTRSDSPVAVAITELQEAYGRAVHEHQWRERVWREKEAEAQTARDDLQRAADKCRDLNEAITVLRDRLP